MEKLRGVYGILPFKVTSEYISKDKTIDIEDQYGVCRTYAGNLLKGITPSIVTAIDKTSYIRNKLREKMGTEFDYSKFMYVNASTRSIIICSKHGEFLQSVGNHLLGRGCSKCNKEEHKKMHLKNYAEAFLLKSKEMHGENYDYSKVVYSLSDTKVTIVCKQHGDFNQAVNTHMSGKGCPKCGLITIGDKHRTTKQNFIEKASVLHNFKYSYEKFEYYDRASKSTIGCPIHGDFIQTASDHLAGCGCVTCGNESVANKSRKSQESFLREVREVHGNLYEYTNVIYKKLSTPVEIICKHHGIFLQKPSDHIKGHGCHTCGRIASAYRRDLTTKDIEDSKNIYCELYIMKFSSLVDQEVFWKIGIARNINHRLSNLKLTKNYKIEVIYTEVSNIYDCYKKEDLFLQTHKDLRYKPKVKFGGHTECFKIDPTKLLQRKNKNI
jgi:hypothetical protein